MFIMIIFKMLRLRVTSEPVISNVTVSDVQRGVKHLLVEPKQNASAVVDQVVEIIKKRCWCNIWVYVCTYTLAISFGIVGLLLKI